MAGLNEEIAILSSIQVEVKLGNTSLAVPEALPHRRQRRIAGKI